MTRKSSRARTGESLDTVPEHGEDDSRYDTEITEPETKRRPVKDREGYMKSGTDSSVEDDDKGNDEVSKSYRRKSLPPGKPTEFSLLHPELDFGDAPRTNSVQ